MASCARLPLLACAMLALAGATAGAQNETLLFNFAGSTDGWHGVDARGNVKPLTTALAPGAQRQRALRVDVAFPKEATIRVKRQFDWSKRDVLRFRVFVPRRGPVDAQVLVYIKDGEDRWYQTLVERPLKRGQWNRVSVDISDRSRYWSFKGHYRPWDGYTKQQIRELGIKLLSRRTYVGPIYIDDIAIASTDRGQSETPPSQLFDFRTNNDVVPRYGKFEITFELSRTYRNPFDPRDIDVHACFVGPSGKPTTVQGFFYQDYIRTQQRKVERLMPMGRSKWKVRFAPTEVGTYRYFVEINDPHDPKPVRTRMRAFQCAQSDNPGYVRVSKRDPNYFEFDNGDFFYPIGHNVCATFDARNAENLEVAVVQGEGTFAYERYFKRMAENGENTARIWFAGWAFSIEWTKSYDIHYNGLGRYNLENAWRLDYVMDLAAKYGIYVMLTFTPHGEMQPNDAQHEESDWGSSPYNVKNGGFLTSPRYFWTHPDARRYYEQKVRYILARWGHSPNVLAWEIFNEVDLARYYRHMGQICAEWTGKTAQFIRDTDPAKHMVTTNLFYLYQTQWAAPLWSRPELDLTTGHLFKANLPEFLRSMYTHMKRYNKPFLVTEAGDTPFGQGPVQTEKYLHMGIWASHAMPYPGAAMPWWWIFIDDRNLYRHFGALAKFAKGQDRRGMGIHFKSGQIIDVTRRRPVPRFGTEACGNKEWAVVWAYDLTYFGLSNDKTPLPADKAALVLADMTPGDYTVEIWDTYEGKIVETRRVKCKGDTLTVTPIKIDRDVALKVKRVAATGAPGKIQWRKAPIPPRP